MVAAGVLLEAPNDRTEPGRLGGDGLHDRRSDGRLLSVLVRRAAAAAAATASMGTLLTPLIGVVAAVIALGEPFGVRETLALALTLGGLLLAIRIRGWRAD